MAKDETLKYSLIDLDEVLDAILSAGKSSRLYDSLVYDSHIIAEVQAVYPTLSAATQAILKDASPIGAVNADLPPFLLVHGTTDMSVPYEQSQRMQKALRRVTKRK